MQVQGMLRAVPVPRKRLMRPDGSLLAELRLRGSRKWRPMLSDPLAESRRLAADTQTQPLGKACDTCWFREADAISI